MNTKRKNIKIPWMMLALGFVFILNPNITIIDPLPDFFGYIIISIALGKLSFLSETLAQAKKAFERMILIDASKTLAIIWIFTIDATSEQNTSILLWCFVFAVLEGVFLIPSYLKLFKGLSDLGDYYSNHSIHGLSKKSNKSYTDKIKIFTLFFVIFKAVMIVLPEIADLTNASYDESSSFLGIYRYIGIMRFLACLPVLVIGIVWFVNILRYFKRIAKDEEFNYQLIEKYKKQIIPSKGLFVIKYVKTACWLLVISSVLTLDITLDGNNIIPDILVLLTLVPAYRCLCKASSVKSKGIYVLFTLYGVLAVVTDVTNYIYQSTYTYNALNRDENAFVLYMLFILLGVFKGFVFMLLQSNILKSVAIVISDHTGYVLGKEINTEGEKKRASEVRREIVKSFIRAIDVLVVYVLADIAVSSYGIFYAFLRVDVGYLSLISIAAGIWYIGMTVGATDRLKEAVETKYMLQ